MTDEADGLRAALLKAADDLAEAAYEIEAWGAYAGEYFRKKHDLDGSVRDVKAQADAARKAAQAK